MDVTLRSRLPCWKLAQINTNYLNNTTIPTTPQQQIKILTSFAMLTPQSSKGNVGLLGFIFMLCFTSFSVIQVYAGKFFGESAGADATCAVYSAFTCGCFLSPNVVTRCGPRASLSIGIAGYVLFVLAGLAVLLHAEEWTTTGKEATLIVGGIGCGLGASILWVAQGQLQLRYSSEKNRGEYFSIFWGLFNGGHVIGGAITLLAFTVASPTAEGKGAGAGETASGPESGAVKALYASFLSALALSALTTCLLRFAAISYCRILL